jgi:hypothetical protein
MSISFAGRALQLAALSAIGLAALPTAQASILTFVGDETSLGANDSFAWGTLGLVEVPNGTHVVTNMNGFSVSEPLDSLEVTNNINFVTSQFGSHDFLSAPQGATQAGPITIDFDAPVLAVGANMEWGQSETADYTIEVFGAGNALLASQTINSDGFGDPAFLGFSDSVPEIRSVEFIYNGPSAPASLALDDLQIVNAPEPMNLGLAGLGMCLLGSLGAIKRRVASARR